MVDEKFLERAIQKVRNTPEVDIPTHKRLLGLLTVVSIDVSTRTVFLLNTY